MTVARDELAAKLATVARGVSTRTTVLVLGGIQLRAEAGQLHLAATDMEISLRVATEAQVEEDGAVVVPGRLLVDIVRLLPAQSVIHTPLADNRAHANVFGGNDEEGRVKLRRVCRILIGFDDPIG